jgi:hypothetical protein
MGNSVAHAGSWIKRPQTTKGTKPAKENTKSCRVGLAPPLPLRGGTGHTLGTPACLSAGMDTRNDPVIPAKECHPREVLHLAPNRGRESSSLLKATQSTEATEKERILAKKAILVGSWLSLIERQCREATAERSLVSSPTQRGGA